MCAGRNQSWIFEETAGLAWTFCSISRPSHISLVKKLVLMVINTESSIPWFIYSIGVNMTYRQPGIAWERDKAIRSECCCKAFPHMAAFRCGWSEGILTVKIINSGVYFRKRTSEEKLKRLKQYFIEDFTHGQKLITVVDSFHRHFCSVCLFSSRAYVRSLQSWLILHLILK